MVYEKEKKPRLFVDMDGTLAEWKTLNLKIKEQENIRPETIRKMIEKILMQPGYFYALRPHQNIVDAINQLVKENEIEVFILSCYMPDKEKVSPKEQKNAWLDKYLPNIDEGHRIFVPDGENKSNYIPNPDKEYDFLLDDYTHNLKQWTHKENAIKYMNGINHTKKTWDGNKIFGSDDSVILVEKIKEIIQDKRKENDIEYEEYERE